jgi:hypothetical protein
VLRFRWVALVLSAALALSACGGEQRS